MFHRIYCWLLGCKYRIEDWKHRVECEGNMEFYFARPWMTGQFRTLWMLNQLRQFNEQIAMDYSISGEEFFRQEMLKQIAVPADLYQGMYGYSRSSIAVDAFKNRL